MTKAVEKNVSVDGGALTPAEELESAIGMLSTLASQGTPDSVYVAAGEAHDIAKAALANLLATIEAKDARIAELKETVDDRETAWADLSHKSGIAIRDLTNRAEAAEARVSELEKERAHNLNRVNYWERRTRAFFSDIPTPPEEEAK